jgi:hypothetical protein
MIKIVKNSLSVGRLGLPDQDYYSSQEKDTKEKEISTSNIPECYSL